MAPVTALHVAVSDVAVGDEMGSPVGAAGTVIPSARRDSVMLVVGSVTPIQYVVPAVSPEIMQLALLLSAAVAVQLPSDDPPVEFAYARAVCASPLEATHVAVSDEVVAADTVGAVTACTGVTTGPPSSSTNTAVISRGIRRRALLN